MTIDDKIEAVTQFQDYAAKYHQRRGFEPTLEEWREELDREAMRSALFEIKAIAGGLLHDEQFRDFAQEILTEVEGF